MKFFAFCSVCDNTTRQFGERVIDRADPIVCVLFVRTLVFFVSIP